MKNNIYYWYIFKAKPRLIKIKSLFLSIDSDFPLNSSAAGRASVAARHDEVRTMGARLAVSTRDEGGRCFSDATYRALTFGRRSHRVAKFPELGLQLHTDGAFDSVCRSPCIHSLVLVPFCVRFLTTLCTSSTSASVTAIKK